MWQTIVLSFLMGLIGANGIPHFVKGITKENYPCVLGNGPIPNLIGGWLAFIVAALCAYRIYPTHYHLPAICSCATGVLLIGLFHAGPGAFGRKTGKC